jgi:RNA polymerase sigma-70 factor, ECF subfamily
LKCSSPFGHIWSLLRLVPTDREESEANAVEEKLDVAGIYAKHASFLWKSLFRMGVSQADLPDVLQEVLLVVHRRLDSFDGSCRLTTWLFAICLCVASTARRGQRRRREDPMDPSAQSSALVESNDPERCALALEARRALNWALDGLDPEKRAVLVMFELEGISCAEIAQLLGVPRGTVFSRLSSARQAFLARLNRMQKREHRQSRVMGAER